VPSAWVGDIRHTLATLSPALSAERMVREYVERLYLPAAVSERAIRTDEFAPARELAAWAARVRAGWPEVHVAHVESGGVDSSPHVGEELHVRAFVEIGALAPDDVAVELMHGRPRAGEELGETHVVPLTLESHDLGRPAVYTGSVHFDRAGAFGYTVRVVPRNALLASDAELGLIAVAQ
jgi:starch phosphorylase